MWQYKRENLGSDREVAEFTNDKGNKALTVIESRNGYQSIPYLKGLESREVPYSQCKIAAEREGKLEGNIDDRLYAMLVQACKDFEYDYDRQVELLLSQF